MKSRRVLAVALGSLLFASLFSLPVSIRSSSFSGLVTPEQSITLRPGYFQYTEIDSFTNSTWIVYNVTSDNPISVALMNQEQFSSFQNIQSDPISNSVTYQNGTMFNQDVRVSYGHFFLVFYAYSFRAVVNYGYLVYPNTPFSYGALYPLEPTGIASFGIKNDSGYVVPYEVRSSEIVGLTNISSLLANNPNAGSYGDNVAGATLQLNANLVVNRSNGLSDVYWVQNTPDFVTSANTVALTDNVWNNTDSIGRMSNQSLTSTNFANGGAVYTKASHGILSYAYLFNENNMTYRFPFSFGLVERESILKDQGVLVQLGYRLFQNGSIVDLPTRWYDNITIHAPDVASAYFEVSGNSTTPVGNFYDAELVFAGEGNLEPTQFVNMSASLGLLFKNDTTGDYTSFPSYYSFGGDTGETATGVNVGYSNGVAYLTVGSSNYVYLGNASLNLVKDYRPSSSFSTLNASIVTGGTSSNAKGGSNHDLAAGLVLIVVVILAVGVVFMVSRKRVPEVALEITPQLICPVCGTVLPSEALYCSNCGTPQR